MINKILIFSPPFNGHLGVLKELIEKFKSMFEFKLVITGWKNVDITAPEKTVRLGKSNLKETDPTLWTFPRVSELLDDCLEITRRFKPDLIIYDYFSIEGYFVGKMLGIPYWCSVPALIGSFEDKEYLKKRLSIRENKIAIERLQEKYNIQVKNIELVSDGIHIPGEINLLWSYPSITPKDFMRNRKGKYVFVGRLVKIPKRKLKKLIYFSLGTVVLNNIWNQQKKTRFKIKKFISEIAKSWNDKDLNVYFVSQGKRILKQYPKNWHVVDKANQIKILSEANIFITHGGNNSFHESIIQKVPMIVIPFFGDQILVGKQVQKLNIGINLGSNESIDTKKSKSFLNKGLVKKLDEAVYEITNNAKYMKNLNKIKLEKESILRLLTKHH